MVSIPETITEEPIITPEAEAKAAAKKERHRLQRIEQTKRYYNKNKQAIQAKQKEKIICECGSNISRASQTTHNKSEKHLLFLKYK